jgi:ubiquinone/menaquinone biosynthesis C-methylase UbiE
MSVNSPNYATYLNRWNVFSSDEQSFRHIVYHLEQAMGSLILETSRNVAILDLCAGTGRAGRSIAQHLFAQSPSSKTSLTFVDSDPSVLRAIDRKAGEHIVADDVTRLSQFANDSFDVAVSRYGFNNLPRESWSLALDAVLRVLRPGGTFILQDHFVPGATFSALLNEAEQFIAHIEGKKVVPFIYSTEQWNDVLDKNVLVRSRVKTGYPIQIQIADRFMAKSDANPNFDTKVAFQRLHEFYENVCYKKYQVRILDPELYIPAFIVTYGILKREP